MFLNAQKHITFKLFIKIQVLVIVNGLSQIILNYLSFTVWPFPDYSELFKLHCKKTNKANSPNFIVNSLLHQSAKCSDYMGRRQYLFSTQRQALLSFQGSGSGSKAPSIFFLEHYVRTVIIHRGEMQKQNYPHGHNFSCEK